MKTICTPDGFMQVTVEKALTLAAKGLIVRLGNVWVSEHSLEGV